MRAFSFILYLGIVAWLAHRYSTPQTPTRVAWALAMTGIWYTLLMGQIYVLVLLITIAAWFLLDKEKPVAAGLLIGLLVAIKPNFLVWPVLLMLAGGWLAALTALGAAGALSLIPLLVYGPAGYRQWVEMLLAYQAAPLATHMSIIGLAARLGLPGWGTLISLLLLAGIDLSLADGAGIPIEERNPDEVREIGGRLLTVPYVEVRNPAFDVTPAAYITAIVTERGVHRTPFENTLG